MNSNLDQIINILIQGLDRIINILQPIWPLVIFIIKVWIYIVYFIPMLGIKLLKYLGLWPNLWPFN